MTQEMSGSPEGLPRGLLGLSFSRRSSHPSEGEITVNITADTVSVFRRFGIGRGPSPPFAFADKFYFVDPMDCGIEKWPLV